MQTVPHSPIRLNLPVEGMTCASCSTRLERVLGNMDGVEEAAVNLTSEKAAVVFDPSRVQGKDLVEAIARESSGVARR